MTRSLYERQVFDVATTVDRLELVIGGEAAEVPFTVTNVEDAAFLGAVRAKFESPARAEWFRVDGPSDFEYGPESSQQYRLRIQVPEGTEPPEADCRATVQAYSLEHPGKVYSNGPWLWLSVREPPPPPPPRPFPWLWVIVAAAIAVALLGGGGWQSFSAEAALDGFAPEVWLPKAWLAGALTLVAAIGGAMALWLILREVPPVPWSGRLPAWWYVVVSNTPVLVLVCGAVLWAWAGWPWLMACFAIELTLATVALGWLLGRTTAPRLDGDIAPVPAWWYVCGVAVLVAILSLGAMLGGITGGEAEAVSAETQGEQPADAPADPAADDATEAAPAEADATAQESAAVEHRIAPVSWLVSALVLDLALVLAAVSWIRMTGRRTSRSPRAWWFVTLIVATVAVLIAGALLWLVIGPLSFFAAVVLTVASSIGLFVWCWRQPAGGGPMEGEAPAQSTPGEIAGQ